MFRNQLKFWGVIVIVSLALTSCKEESSKKIATQPIEFKKEGELSIFKKDTDSLRTRFNIEFAENDYETQTGLMYRDRMENKQGMLFIFPEEAMHSFYMKNTRFALDILYIDEDLKIASLQENAEPLNESGLSSKVPVKYVLEINGGLAQGLGIVVGDSISYKRNE